MRPLVFYALLLWTFQWSFAQTGEVGIGTLTPQAMLHVDSGAVLFNGGLILPMIPGSPPVSGTGVRMMWYPDKAAFRAGILTMGLNTRWDKDSIGVHSFAAGQNTLAKGVNSTALGGTTAARGHHSVAMGSASNASGLSSTATGIATTASGQGSFSAGDSAIASGIASFAQGMNTTASGDQAFAIGNFTEASGDYSFASGRLTKSAGGYASALGWSTIANGATSLVIGKFNDTIVAPQNVPLTNTPLFIIGNGTSNANRSNAMVVRSDGRVGIGTSTPLRRFHLSQGTGGGLYSNSAIMVLEDDDDHYLQLSAPTGSESGILFGNAVSAIRSGVVFGPNNELDLRAGGNATRLRVESDGDVNLFSGELHRTSTGDANLVPVCFGSVSSNSAINSGSGNFSVTSDGTGVYIISIDDIAYTSLNYTAIATANNSVARIINTSTSGDDLVIRIFDITGALVSNAFQFVVYN